MGRFRSPLRFYLITSIQDEEDGTQKYSLSAERVCAACSYKKGVCSGNKSKEKGYSGEFIETREYLRQINIEWIESHLETRESMRGKNPNSLANLRNQEPKKNG